YPTPEFEEAWKKILLYTEHTWGAWQSVSDPEHPMTKEQWAVKQSYALDADARSRQLLEKAAVSTATVSSVTDMKSVNVKSNDWDASDTTATSHQIDIYNTTSWARTEAVTIPAELSRAGDRIVDMQNNPVPSQRMSDGTLAIIVSEIPAYSCRRYTVESGRAYCDVPVSVRGTVLDNGIITVRVDSATGTITELRLKTDPVNFAHAKADSGLNGFLYLPGDKIADVRMDSHVRITVKENGPLVASLVIASDAPSCNSFTREVRLASGCGYVELINTIDKQRAAISPTPGDGAFAQKGGKESLNFSFPFNVADGRVVLDIPLGVMEPEKDQMPGACKNWLTLGRWADVSNQMYGVTWASLDAPLVEVGKLSANLIGSQTDPSVWRKTIEPTQTLYSWVMNNHWGTNFRAYQDGVVTFRYALKPHGKFAAADASKFATALSQPLIIARAQGEVKSTASLMTVAGAPSVVVTALKPSDDRRGVMITLFNTSAKKETVGLDWSGAFRPTQLWKSSTSEKKAVRIDAHDIVLDPYGLIILRAE
ncbi:MAG TPA: glycoside hydrolase family 38 C-terminal domain-containing protein, partial [Bacteroidota bacterium]|nr:glycoside hydrolase family 38 C-terminal domain-containing protein [Bacteroidota bacterium]